MTCLICGKKFQSKAHNAKHCSRDCKLEAKRRRWAASHGPLKNYIKTCVMCRKTFESRRAQRKYCSDECYKSAVRMRKRLARARGVDQRLPVEQAHRISIEVERRVNEEMPIVESLIIHIEPQKQERLRVVLPILEEKGMGSPVTPHFGEAPYFLFVDIEGESVQRWFMKDNPSLGLKRKKGVILSELIIEEDATTLLTAEIGEGPYHILRDSFVAIYELSENVSAEEAVKIFLEGKLERIEQASQGKKKE